MFYVENILSVPFLWKTEVVAKCVIEFSLKLLTTLPKLSLGSCLAVA